MSRQAESWTTPYGHPQQKGLVGQIYFPFDDDNLDPNDKEVLDSLLEHYIITLLGTPVRLSFEGHCDFRGSVDYNRRLAMRRANAVQAYFDKTLKTSFQYFSSSAVSFGERYAGNKDMHLDRRVDIISSFVPKRPPIELPELHIRGKVPKKYVRRPVQFLDIEFQRFGSGGPHDTGTATYHVIILEKHDMIEQSRSFPHNPRVTHTKVHQVLPLPIQVHRYAIDWRKPQASDTAKKVSAVILNILASAAGKAGGWDFGEGVPALKPPNIVYGSWDEFEARAKGDDREYLQYKGKPFSN